MDEKEKIYVQEKNIRNSDARLTFILHSNVSGSVLSRRMVKAAVGSGGKRKGLQRSYEKELAGGKGIRSAVDGRWR
jgi:hypothetical protein